MSTLPLFRNSEIDGDDRRSIPMTRCHLNLEVTDPETVTELQGLSEGSARDLYALKALRIGVLALRQARGQVDVQAVRSEGDRLLELLNNQFHEQSRVLQERVNGTLKEYFDPESGRLEDRVRRLLKQDGELEEVLRRQIGLENSELSRTLKTYLGEESPLLKWLSPDATRGLLGAMSKSLEDRLTHQAEHVIGEFSLDNKEGALSRLIAELGQQQTSLRTDLGEQIQDIVSQFSLDKDDSVLSRLVSNVTRAQETISREFSFDHETSALSRLKKLLEQTQSSLTSQLSLDESDSALARLQREILKVLETQRETNQKFQEEVKLVLNEFKTRREEAARSTRHGLEFEQVLIEWLQSECQGHGEVFSPSGHAVGAIPRCKKGDATLDLGPDSATPGARIVFEAKQDASYQLADARQEIEEARQNREAQVGVFVFSRKTAPKGIEGLSRIGQDIFVVWDVEDPSTDLYLRTALTLARALLVRQSVKSNEVETDLNAIMLSISSLEKGVESLVEIETWTRTINNNSAKVLEKTDKLRKMVESQVELLKAHTESLKAVFKKSGE